MRYLEMCWCIFKFSYFPDIFLLLSWFKWVMVWEHTLYDLSSFNFVLVCFVAQNLVYLGECPMCIWEKCVISYSWVVFCKYQLRHVPWWCCSEHVYISIYLYIYISIYIYLYISIYIYIYLLIFCLHVLLYQRKDYCCLQI